MNINTYLYIVTAFATSFICAGIITSLPTRYISLDKPNSRSLHYEPTPRLGGIAIIFGILAPISAYYFANDIAAPFILILGYLLVAIISLIDDYIKVSSIIRLIVHILSAILAVNAGYMIELFSAGFGEAAMPTYINITVSVILIVWMINLYNFMDGIDGLAGGMAAFGFGAFAVIGYMEGQAVFTIINLILVSSSLGFLAWNYPPAKIFMGDNGSSSLGFLAAVLSIWAHVNEVIPIWISGVIFSPFLMDATVTLIIRVVKREQFWIAHKTHHYQLLAESGMERRKLVNSEYVLMLVCSVIAIITYNAEPEVQALFILMLIILYIILMQYVRKQSVKSPKLSKI